MIYLYQNLTKLFCLFDFQHGHLRVDELAKPLAKNVRALITPERYVPHDFLHLETMILGLISCHA